MTGEELRRRAINGARGWPIWAKTPRREKGPWNWAALEVTYLEEKVALLEEKLARLTAESPLSSLVSGEAETTITT